MSNKTPTLFDDFFAEEDNNPAPKAEPVKKKKNTKEKAEDAASLSLFLERADEDNPQAETGQTGAKEDLTGEHIPSDEETKTVVSDHPAPGMEDIAVPGVSETDPVLPVGPAADLSSDEDPPDRESEKNDEDMEILDQNIRTELPYRFSFETEAPASEPDTGPPPKKKGAIVFEDAPLPVEKKTNRAEIPRQEPEKEDIPISEAEDTLPAAAAIELTEWNLDKKYYTISMVAKMFDVNISHIRFWTNEFNLKPRTNKKGDRLYTPELIETLRLIHHLVKVQHHTIKGAKAKLKTKKAAVDAGITLKENLVQLKETLLELRNQIN